MGGELVGLFMEGMVCRWAGRQREKRPCPWFVSRREAMAFAGQNAVRGVDAGKGRRVSKGWIVPNTRLTCKGTAGRTGLTALRPLMPWTWWETPHAITAVDRKTASSQHATHPARAHPGPPQHHRIYSISPRRVRVYSPTTPHLFSVEPALDLSPQRDLSARRSLAITTLARTTSSLYGVCVFSNARRNSPHKRA